MTRALIRPALIAAALLVPAAVPAEEPASQFSNIVNARYVHCAFYKAYDIDSATGDFVMVEGHSNSLTHFQRIGNGHARQISTRVAGSRDVRVMDWGKYLHFVDTVAGMYVLTTIYGCIDHDPRTGVCVTYGATQSRHFDPRVLTDPDAVYDEWKASADVGFCDHSFIGIQEASHGGGAPNTSH
jgi:hypothetical protein